jgi:hypothetical protein
MWDKKKIVIGGIGAALGAAFVMSVVSFVLFLHLNGVVRLHAENWKALEANFAKEVIAVIQREIQAQQQPQPQP